MYIQVAAVVLLTLSSASGEFMRKPVSRWNNDDVMAWVGGLGNWATHNVSQAFLKEVWSYFTVNCIVVDFKRIW